MSQKINIIVFSLAILTAAVFFSRPASQAAAYVKITEQQAQILNQIKTQVNTGGAGQSSGQATAQTEVTTVINGQQVENIQLSDQGEEARIEVNSQVQADGQQAEVSRHTKAGEQERTEQRVVDIDQPPEDQPAAETEQQSTARSNEDKPQLSRQWQQVLAAWQRFWWQLFQILNIFD